MLLGQLGLSQELNGELLLPVGTVYDPFVCRGLDALIYGVYSGSKFVFAGTPAGVTLSPEGGAHQSAITASIGMELPNLRLFEPCFARETEWCLLEGLRLCVDRQNGLSTYLRLSTRAIDQAPFAAALTRLGEDELRRQVLLGGYRLLEPTRPSAARRRCARRPGPICPRCSRPPTSCTPKASRRPCSTSPAPNGCTLIGRLRRSMPFAAGHVRRRRACHRSAVPPSVRRSPIVTVLDGASHALASSAVCTASRRSRWAWIVRAVGRPCRPVLVRGHRRRARRQRGPARPRSPGQLTSSRTRPFPGNLRQALTHATGHDARHRHHRQL